MDIRTEITQENIDEVREIMSALHARTLHPVCVGSYLNLDTSWDKRAADPNVIFILPPSSTLLSASTLVSYEEFKQTLFAYLMEN